MALAIAICMMIGWRGGMALRESIDVPWIGFLEEPTSNHEPTRATVRVDDRGKYTQ